MRLTALAIAIFFTATALAQRKPNILWITFEDTSPQFVGCYGNKNAKTPVMDSLAAKGVRAKNAFSTGTVCSPSRTTIITGLRTYEAGTGHHRSNYALPSLVHGFPYYLIQAGYYATNNAKTDYNVRNPDDFIKDAWSESSAKAGWWNRQPGQPFFAVFNYMDSHQSRTMTTSYESYEKDVLQQLNPDERIADDAFAMPPFYRDSREMRKQFARVYNSIKLTDKKIGLLLQRLAKDGLMDSTIIFCFADHGEGIPRGKTNGINLGYRVPFIAWFPPAYQHLSPWKGRGLVTDELIDFNDLAPTMLALAGADVPSYMTGRIFAGEKRAKPPTHLVLSSDRSDNGPDCVRTVTDGRWLYSRNYMPFMPEVRYIRYMEISDIKQQMRKDVSEGKLNAAQASLFSERPAEFLFDTQADPWELRNLANDAGHKAVLERMRKQLTQRVMDAKDVMLVPEYELGLISETSSPHEFRMNTATYPLKEIYAAASLSGQRNTTVAAAQAKLLQSKNKVVRYWAVVGLRSQKGSVLSVHKAAIAKAINDDYPPVAITAAALAYENFGSSEAQRVLKKYCADANPVLSVMAINYLLYSTNKTPFVETIKTVYSDKSKPYDVKAACLDFLGSLGLVANDWGHRE